MSQYFKNIAGHQKQLDWLNQDLVNNNLAHAYLLAGPSDLGKSTIAKSFAKAIQTYNLNTDKAYSIVNQIEKGTHSDTIFIANNFSDSSIKIEQIRTITHNLHMTGNSQKRILVIEDIERLTPESANALLKILEEPPEKVVFILTSSNPKLILETILSRVRRIDFQLISNKDLFQILKNRYRLVEEKKIYRVTELSQGRIAKAIKLLDNSEHFEIYENTYLQIQNFLKRKDVSAAFNFIGQIYNDPILTQIFLEIAFMVLRENLNKAIVNNDENEIIKANKNIEKLLEVKRLAETNVNSRLLLEEFILSL